MPKTVKKLPITIRQPNIREETGAEELSEAPAEERESLSQAAASVLAANGQTLPIKESEEGQHAKRPAPSDFIGNLSEPLISGELPPRYVSRFTSRPNPFTLSRELFAQEKLVKTGYRISKDYMNILILAKSLKERATLEGLLHDALTHYFETHEDGQKALKAAEHLHS